MGAIKFPQTIKKGSVSIKIYRYESSGYLTFAVAYYQDGRRKRTTFASYDDAKAEADVVATRLGNSDSDVLTLRSADRAAYLRAIELLAESGVRLETAAADFAAAQKALGEVPLMRAVEFYLAKHPRNLKPVSVEKAAAELVKAKEADGRSPGYVKHLRYDLEKFSQAFKTQLAAVKGTEIDEWLRGLAVSGRTRNNLRNSIQNLFNFAKGRKWLPKDHDEIDSVLLAKDSSGEIEIFAPAEFEEILQHAKADLVPFLMLGAFAGIRHAEIQRLEWKDIDFDAGIIEIKAAKAKTASRRTIPLLPNLRAALAPIADSDAAGPVCNYSNVSDELSDLVRAINKVRREKWAKANNISADELDKAGARARKRLVELRKKGRLKRGENPLGAETAKEEGWTAFAWKHNALRHSFISYRVAKTQNVAQVALEAGNTPQMIFKHYRELVRPTEAEKWFGVVPLSVVKTAA